MSVPFGHREQQVINLVLTSLIQKKLGAWAQAQAESSGYEGIALAVLTRYKKWTKEEVLVLASQARADARRRDIHMIFNL